MVNLFKKSYKQDLDEFDPDPLTELENKKIRKIIRDQERMEWFWASARIWVGWLAAGGAALYASKEYINKVLKVLFST